MTETIVKEAKSRDLWNRTYGVMLQNHADTLPKSISTSNCGICRKELKDAPRMHIGGPAGSCSHYCHASCAQEWYQQGNFFCPTCFPNAIAEQGPSSSMQRPATVAFQSGMGQWNSTIRDDVQRRRLGPRKMHDRNTVNAFPGRFNRQFRRSAQEMKCHKEREIAEKKALEEWRSRSHNLDRDFKDPRQRKLELQSGDAIRNLLKSETDPWEPSSFAFGATSVGGKNGRTYRHPDYLPQLPTLEQFARGYDQKVSAEEKGRPPKAKMVQESKTNIVEQAPPKAAHAWEEIDPNAGEKPMSSKDKRTVSQEGAAKGRLRPQQAYKKRTGPSNMVSTAKFMPQYIPRTQNAWTRRAVTAQRQRMRI